VCRHLPRRHQDDSRNLCRVSYFVYYGLVSNPEFSFLTNHGKTLVLLANDCRMRMRDVARRLDITERATQRIVADLARAGYIVRERDGRRNRYTVRDDVPLGLPIQRDIDVGSLLAVLDVQDEARDEPSEGPS